MECPSWHGVLGYNVAKNPKQQQKKQQDWAAAAGFLNATRRGSLRGGRELSPEFFPEALK